MDCGFQQLPGFPEQEQIKGLRMVELKDVLGLVKSYRAKRVKLNIETKVEAGAPEQTAPRELFVRRVFEEIRRSGIERQVTDPVLRLGGAAGDAPARAALAAGGADQLRLPRGRASRAPRPGSAASTPTTTTVTSSGRRRRFPGVTALSPNYGFPQNGTVARPGLPVLPRQGDGRRGAPARPEGDPVDL